MAITPKYNVTGGTEKNINVNPMSVCLIFVKNSGTKISDGGLNTFHLRDK